MHSTINYTPQAKENSYKPGPGQYNGDYKKIKFAQPSFRVGSSTRLDLEQSKKCLF